MPTATSKIKKVVRKPAAKRAVKKTVKRRSPAKRLQAEIVEPVISMPEPVVPPPVEEVHEVQPVVSESHVSTVMSRLSFYLGVITGAAMLHVLIFALITIVNS